MNFKSIAITSVVAITSIFGGAIESKAQYGGYGAFIQGVREIQSSPLGQYNTNENCRQRYGMMDDNGYRRATGPQFQWCVNEINNGRNPW
ncbi:hypothetical protein OAL32_01970 [Synechococcus sp. AH-551-G15]|nr:hypothetical protein [Synechococcus sp. AH-551-G15]